MLVLRPDRPGNYLLTVKLRPFLAPQLARQRLTIEVNGAPLANFEAGDPEPSVRSCLIPSGITARAEVLEPVPASAPSTMCAPLRSPREERLSKKMP